jgi:hypothetical protein
MMEMKTFLHIFNAGERERGEKRGNIFSQHYSLFACVLELSALCRAVYLERESQLRIIIVDNFARCGMEFSFVRADDNDVC